MTVSETSKQTSLLSLYDLLWRMLVLLVVPLARLFPKLQPQLADRSLAADVLQGFAEKRRKFQRAVVFFCSSAGEYEQARPLMDRLQKQGDTFVFLIFVSHSGKRFALAQQETIPFVMAPWDSPRAWQALFEAIQPNAFVVVRYELWPGFLHVARRRGPVYLIDAVRSPGLVEKSFSRSLRRKLVGLCHKVFVVGPGDLEFYRDLLRHTDSRRSRRSLGMTEVPNAGVGLSGKIEVVGDTKYDRVLERLQQRESQRLQMQAQLKDFLGTGPLLILGSAWPRDLEELLKVFPELQVLHPDLKLIVAPHDISASMVSKMEASLRSLGLAVCRAQEAGLAAARASDNVLLVDLIGLLPELYAMADIAWVGGAMHHRVHNVLEPACQGLFVCFGPRYQTSQEARQLVSEGLVQVIESGQDFLDWVRTLHWEGHPPHRRLYEAIIQHQGASDRILIAMKADALEFRS